MAHANLNAFLVCVGIIFMVAPVSSTFKACSEQSMSKCGNQDQSYGPCKYYEEIAACFEGLEKNCTDDILIERLTSARVMLRSVSEKCSGMEDNTCLTTELTRCEEKAPFYMRYQIQHSEQRRKEYCPQIKDKFPHAKNCSLGLKAKCSSTQSDKLIDDSVRRLESVEKLCEGHN